MELIYEFTKADIGLSSLVDRYWTIENKSDGIQTIEVFPDHCFDLIIKKEFGQKTEIYITGIWNKGHRIDIPGQSLLIGINFYPLALDPYFNISLETLVNDYASFDNRMLKYNSRFPDALIRDTQSPKEVIRGLEAYFLAFKSKGIKVPGYYNNEQISDILDTTHWSDKALRRWYQKWFGLSPKAYIDLARQVKARHLLLSTDMTMVDIAMNLGFYDQAHFTKGFKRMYGILPSKFRETYKMSDFYNPYTKSYSKL